MIQKKHNCLNIPPSRRVWGVLAKPKPPTPPSLGLRPKAPSSRREYKRMINKTKTAYNQAIFVSTDLKFDT